MSNNTETEKITEQQLNELLRQAAIDEVVKCYKCQYGPMEPDYDNCPECEKPNPLKEYGLI